MNLRTENLTFSMLTLATSATMLLVGCGSSSKSRQFGQSPTPAPTNAVGMPATTSDQASGAASGTGGGAGANQPINGAIAPGDTKELVSQCDTVTRLSVDTSFGGAFWVNGSNTQIKGSSNYVKLPTFVAAFTARLFSYGLKITGFRGLEIPDNATVTGIKFTFNRLSLGQPVMDNRVSLIVDGEYAGVDQAEKFAPWRSGTSTADTSEYVYGGNSATWGLQSMPITPPMLKQNAPGIGIVVSVKPPLTGAYTARIVSCSVTLEYQ